MRKFLIPIVNLVNIILVSISFGLANNTAVVDSALSNVGRGNYYQLVWNAADKANVIGIVGFFLFVVAAALMLVNFVPFKCRKYTAVLTGGMFIASGVLFLMTPAKAALHFIDMKLTGSLIAMAVLVIIAGALSLVMAALDFTAKKAE